VGASGEPVSLHHTSSSGGLGNIVILPWWIFGPLIILALVIVVASAVDDANHMPEWTAKADDEAAAWVHTTLPEGSTVLSCRHEEGSIFHCNARTAAGVVAFDCDGRGEHACETCNE